MLPSSRARTAAVVIAIVLLGLGAGLRLRIAKDWVFAGSDSYGYLKLADELRTHGRYALGPPPEPLHWGRPPVYPIFLMLAKGDAKAEMSGGPGWMKIKVAQLWLDLLVVGLLVPLMALRLAGPIAGLVALVFAMFWPLTVIPTAAALTESLATTLTVAAIAPLILGAHRPRLWYPVAGGLTALCTLCRPDGLLLAAAFVPALWRLRGPASAAPPSDGDRVAPPRASSGWRARLREPILTGVLALGGFLVVFAPWPIRNLTQLGEAHPLGGRVDRSSRPVVHYQGYWDFLRAISWDWVPMTNPTTCFYDRPCINRTSDLERFHAYDSVEERERVKELFDERNRDGLTRAVSDGFARLAAEHRARHLFSVEVLRPISRAFHMWVAPFDELLQNPSWRPWRQVIGPMVPAFLPLSVLFLLAMLAGSALMLLDPGTRAGAAVLVTAIFTRTAVMAYTFYSMPRYALEVMPLGFVLIAGGAVLAVRHLRRTAMARTRIH